MDYLKVSSKSSPASVAGAIAGLIKDGLPVEIQSVGAGAVNQAVKAVAIARGFLIPTGIDVACVPTFQDIEIDGACRTAIRISVVPHALALPGSAAATQPEAAAVPAPEMGCPASDAPGASVARPAVCVPCAEPAPGLPLAAAAIA